MEYGKKYDPMSYGDSYEFQRFRVSGLVLEELPGWKVQFDDSPPSIRTIRFRLRDPENPKKLTPISEEYEPYILADMDDPQVRMLIRNLAAKSRLK